MAVIVTGLMLLILAYITDNYAVNILFWDQWDFYSPLFTNHSWIDLFARQHGPHRQGISFVLLEHLDKLTSWDSRFESFYILGLIFLACIIALLIKRALIRKSSWIDAIVPLSILTATQIETLIVTPNPSHAAFPLFMLMMYVFLTIYRGNLVFLACLQLCLVFTGFGLALVPAALAVLITDIKRERHRSIFLIATLATSCALFFTHYQANQILNRTVIERLTFISDMFAQFVGFGDRVGAIIAVSMIVLLAFHLYRFARSGNKLSAAIILLAGTSLWYAVLTSLGRTIVASRYMTLIAPAYLALGLYALSFATLYRNLLGSVLIYFMVHGSVSALTDTYIFQYYSTGKQLWKDCYLRTEDINGCSERTGFNIYPDPQATHLKQKLDYLKVNKLNLFKDINK